MKAGRTVGRAFRGQAEHALRRSPEKIDFEIAHYMKGYERHMHRIRGAVVLSGAALLATLVHRTAAVATR